MLTFSVVLPVLVCSQFMTRLSFSYSESNSRVDQDEVVTAHYMFMVCQDLDVPWFGRLLLLSL